MYRNIVSRKRFQSFILSVGISAGFFCAPLIAQEVKGWQFGSLPAISSASKPDDQQIYELLLKMLDRWNAHDIEGYMEVYWKSPADGGVSPAERNYFTAMQNDSSDEDVISFGCRSLIWTTIEYRCLSSSSGREEQPNQRVDGAPGMEYRSTGKQSTRQLFLSARLDRSALQGSDVLAKS
jgi:hypothetical protein